MSFGIEIVTVVAAIVDYEWVLIFWFFYE